MAAVLVALPATRAQQQPEGPAAERRKLRLLPLGDAPPFRQEVRDGVRHELEPEPGSIPPRLVTLAAAGGEAVSLRLNLGQTTPPVTLPGGPQTVEVRADQDRPWLDFQLAAPGDQLVVVWRDVARGSWLEPRCLVLPEAGFGGGMLRLVNTTGAVVTAALGQGAAARAQQIPARSWRLVRAGVTGGLLLQLRLAADPPGKRPFYSTSLVMNEGERGQLLVYSYRAERLAGSPPAKVVLLRDRVVPIAPPAEPAAR